MKQKGRAFLITALLAAVLAALPAVSMAGEAQTVFVADGGYYVSGPFFTYSDVNIWVNMTVTQGGPVDVYVMTGTQYSNSYPSEEGRMPSVSYLEWSLENVTSAALFINISVDGLASESIVEDAVYVIVDNRDCALTPGDAVPVGPVTVELEADSSYDFTEFGDDFFGFILLLTILPFALLIVAAIVIIYTIKSSEKKRQLPPPPQWPAPPAQPPAP